MRLGTATLHDGTSLTVGRLPGARAVGITVAVPCGMTAEAPGQASFAHLAEHILHHFGTDETGVTLERRIHVVGGISNAQTYPFHTEYSFVVPASGGPAEVIRWADRARRRLRWPDIDPAEFEAEKDVIGREVDQRLSSSPLAGFPWKDALGTRSDHYAWRHDGFAMLDDVASSTEDEVRSFVAANYSRAPLAVAVVGDFDPEGVISAAGAPGPDGRTPAADRSDPLEGLDDTFHLESTDSSMTGWVQAEVRRVTDATPTPSRRARAMVGTQLANLLDPTTRWQAGLFGAESGPDHDLIVSLSSGAPDRPRLPVEMPAITNLPRSAAVDALALARRAAIDRFDRHLSATATCSSLLARDSLYGLDTAGTRLALQTVSVEDVDSFVDLVGSNSPGVLVRTGGRRGRDIEEAAA